MEVSLKDIYFGRADGSQEAEEERFEDLFYKGNNKYDLLCDDINKFIISGKKGTGKTILAKYFEKEKNKDKIPTKILNKRELVLNIYLEKGQYELDREETELFIEYTLLCEISKVMLEHKRKFVHIKNVFKCGRIVQHLNKLKKLVVDRFPEDNYGIQSFETSDAIEAEVKCGLGSETSNFSSGMKANASVGKIFNKNSYFHIINGIKGSLLYLLKALPINLIFDDLDELDEKIDGNESLVKFLIDFIEVANSLNNDFRKNRIEDSRIIILMRSDIIKVLNENSSNLNKIIADSEIRLNWIKKVRGSKMHPLMELIVTKIKKSNGMLEHLSNDEVMRQFFPEKVNGIPIMDHMLNCSFGRPRDIINMLNIIKNEYPEAQYFSADSFKDTQQEYSRKFTDELRNELSTHYEQEIIEECFNIIHYINKKEFWMSDIKAAMENHKEKIVFFTTEEKFADFIYKHGIAGNTWRNENPNERKKYNFSWKYREDGSENPDYDKKFYLHLGLRKSLLV